MSFSSAAASQSAIGRCVFSRTQWFQNFVTKVDGILFPLFKLHFINPDQEKQKSNCTMSNCLAAIGENGRTALHNAVASGFGKLFGLTAL
jgi:hypothetical protein